MKIPFNKTFTAAVTVLRSGLRYPLPLYHLFYKLDIIQRPEYKECLADDVLFRNEFPYAAVIAVSAIVTQHEIIFLT